MTFMVCCCAQNLIFFIYNKVLYAVVLKSELKKHLMVILVYIR